MKHFKYITVLALILIFSYKAHAQYYVTGQDPASFRWMTASTTHFRFIFPAHDTATAFAMMSAFEMAYEPVSRSYGILPRHIPVIIHSGAAISNGLVVWAPRRSELFPNPAQDMLSSDNNLHLAIHEFRHIVQMSMMHRGLGKVMYVIMGEQSVGVLAGLFLPLWFLEGDAVCAETAFTLSGRGRQPSFTAPLTAQLVQNGRYSYDKAVYGSYKHHIPGPYELGFILTAHARKHYGDSVWTKVLDNVARKPYTLRPFDKGLLKTTGFRKTQLYRAAMDTLKAFYQQHKPDTTIYKRINPIHKAHVTYTTPVFTSKGIVAIKSSLAETPQLTSFGEDGKEKKLFNIPPVNETGITTNGTWLACIEHAYHPRWQHKSYDNVVLYNITSGKKKKLTSCGRYQTAALTAQGDKIAAFYTTESGAKGLHILSATDGSIIKEISTPYHMLRPSWCQEGRYLTAIYHNGLGKAIGITDTKTGETHMLTSFEADEIGNPLFYKNNILFISNQSGINNVYALDTISKQKYMLTSAAFNAGDISIDAASGALLYTNTHALGNDIVSVNVDSLLQDPADSIVSIKNPLTEAIAKQENTILHPIALNTDSITLKPYRKAAHLFNVHSWAPLYINTDNNAVAPGAVIFSQNHLNTALTSLGYNYHVNEGTGKYSGRFEYSGFYPVLDIEASHGRRRFSAGEQTVTATEDRITGGISIPLNLSSGNYFRGLSLGSNVQMIFLNPDADSLKFRKIQALNYSFSFYNSARMAKRDIYPRWAQTLNITYAHTPLSGDNMGALSAIAANFYAPGLLPHHALFTPISYQSRQNGDYTFSYVYSLPRGYYNVKDNYTGIAKGSVNYAFPLLYPDWNAGGLFYIKRLRMLMFADYAETRNSKNIMRSYGAEFLADMHVLRFIAPVNLGVRSIYRPDNNTWRFEPLFSVNFDDL